MYIKNVLICSTLSHSRVEVAETVPSRCSKKSKSLVVMQDSAQQKRPKLLPQRDSHLSSSSSSSLGQKIKLPPQLVALIHGQDSKELADEEEMQVLPDINAPQGEGAGTGLSSKASVTKIVQASHQRFTKELASYTRVISMRLGYT